MGQHKKNFFPTALAIYLLAECSLRSADFAPSLLQNRKREIASSESGIDAAKPRVISHPVYRKHVGREPRIDLIFFRYANYVVEA